MPDMNENAETQQEYFGVRTDNKGTLYNALRRIEELEMTVGTLRTFSNEQATCIERLEKENAELKEQKEMLEKGYVWHDYDAGEDCYEDTHEGKWVKRDEVYQLTKAKELLERLLITSCNSDVLNLLPNCSEVLRVRVEAEQFLSEVEK